MIKFFVAGVPAPQGSKRHVGGGRMIESSKRLRPWREAVTAAAREHVPDEPLDKPVRVSLDFYLPRPKRTKFGDWPAGKPDADKLARAILDSCTDAQIFVDDSRVVSLHVRKHWADDEPGVSVMVEPLWDYLRGAL